MKTVHTLIFGVALAIFEIFNWSVTFEAFRRLGISKESNTWLCVILVGIDLIVAAISCLPKAAKLKRVDKALLIAYGVVAMIPAIALMVLSGWFIWLALCVIVLRVLFIIKAFNLKQMKEDGTT